MINALKYPEIYKSDKLYDNQEISDKIEEIKENIIFN